MKRLKDLYQFESRYVEEDMGVKSRPMSVPSVPLKKDKTKSDGDSTFVKDVVGATAGFALGGGPLGAGLGVYLARKLFKK
jgi:hypothetical protein